MICSLSGISSNLSAQPRQPKQGNHKPAPQQKPGSSNKPAPQQRPGSQHKPAPQQKPGSQHKHAPQQKPGSHQSPAPNHRPEPHHNPAPKHRPAPNHRSKPYHRPAPQHNGYGPHVVRASESLRVAEDPRTGLYGYLNNIGMWVITPTYRYAKSFNREIGLAVVRISNGYWGAINRLGQTVILFNFDSQYDVESAIRSMQKGRYRGIDLWEVYDPVTNLWGYLDYTGNWYLTPQFLYAKAMSDRGIAVVQFTNGLWGAITRQGKIVIQPNFNSQYDVESAIRNMRL